MMTAVRVGTNSDVAELCEALGNLSRRAQREFPKVGNDKLATPWDLRHVAINDALDLWELARD